MADKPQPVQKIMVDRKIEIDKIKLK